MIFLTSIRSTIQMNTKSYKNFHNEKKKLEKRLEKRRKERKEEMIDIVMEMSGCSYALAKISLEENDMEILSAINQIKSDQEIDMFRMY